MTTRCRGWRSWDWSTTPPTRGTAPGGATRSALRAAGIGATGGLADAGAACAPRRWLGVSWNLAPDPSPPPVISSVLSVLLSSVLGTLEGKPRTRATLGLVELKRPRLSRIGFARRRPNRLAVRQVARYSTLGLTSMRSGSSGTPTRSASSPGGIGGIAVSPGQVVRRGERPPPGICRGAVFLGVTDAHFFCAEVVSP